MIAYNIDNRANENLTDRTAKFKDIINKIFVEFHKDF